MDVGNPDRSCVQQQEHRKKCDEVFSTGTIQTGRNADLEHAVHPTESELASARGGERVSGILECIPECLHPFARVLTLLAYAVAGVCLRVPATACVPLLSQIDILLLWQRPNEVRVKTI